MRYNADAEYDDDAVTMMPRREEIANCPITPPHAST